MITIRLNYPNRLCDLVDEMEFNRLTDYTREKADKLNLCKRYLAVLARSPVAGMLRFPTEV